MTNGIKHIDPFFDWVVEEFSPHDSDKPTLSLNELISKTYEKYISLKKAHSDSRHFDWHINYTFPNHFTASVISGKYAYGKFAEVLIIRQNEPYANDIISCDSFEQMEETLGRIYALPKSKAKLYRRLQALEWLYLLPKKYKKPKNRKIRYMVIVSLILIMMMILGMGICFGYWWFSMYKIAIGS
jgi:hypothetical protein